MSRLKDFAEEHAQVTRRYFLGTGAAAVTGIHMANLSENTQEVPPLLADAVSGMEYLTQDEGFRNYGRGEPPPHTLSPERRREVGLDPATWQLEIVPDPSSDAKVAHVMSKELGTALSWDGLVELAKKHAVRFMSAMTCTNDPAPCGMGLWEGVPLREVIWLASPVENVRRVFYYGYHNDDAKQRFQSSLSLGRVLEDPPGEHPVTLCYKLNDQWLSPKRGAPVRMIVPDAYGNKSVEWLQRIVLTNNYQANDTYALWNNDTESPRKTHARFVLVPANAKAGQPVPVTGIAQVGMSGLKKVQCWLCPESAALPKDDPYFASSDWRDAAILPPPAEWGGGLPGGRLPPVPLQMNPADGRPYQWPMRNTVVHWAALIEGIAPGRYHLRCRTIDANDIAQPMPRPFPKSGNNAIHKMELVVEG